jgi:hypothetical protein
MAQTLLKKASQQFIRLSSCDSKNALEPSPDSELNGPEGTEAQHGRKLGNVASKRWKPLRSAFKNMRISGRSGKSSRSFTNNLT